MATYQIMYWQEIPAHVKAEDGTNEVKLELDPKFMEHIDEVAHERGLIDSDAYLEQWRWGEEQERDGSAQEVAEAVKRELEAKADWS